MWVSEVGGVVFDLTEWLRSVESFLVLGIHYLFYNSKTVWRYMDGLIFPIEESYILNMIQSFWELFL